MLLTEHRGYPATAVVTYFASKIHVYLPTAISSVVITTCPVTPKQRTRERQATKMQQFALQQD